MGKRVEGYVLQHVQASGSNYRPGAVCISVVLLCDVHNNSGSSRTLKPRKTFWILGAWILQLCGFDSAGCGFGSGFLGCLVGKPNGSFRK